MSRAGGAAASGDGAGTGPASPGLAREVAELRERLRPVCRDWGDAEFEALVQRMARTKLRWADGERE
jgi:hypothetical protein